MTRRRAGSSLTVFMNGRRVGVLRRAANAAIDFQYDADWLGWTNAMAVSLSLPLRDDRYVGAPVIAVFDNLLPDSDAIRRRIAGHVGAEGIDAYSLLAAIGRDCVGALQFLAEGDAPDPLATLHGVPVSDAEIAAIITHLTETPLGLDDDDDFRISVAGAQEKTALLRKDGQWLRPEGTTPTTHIFKPQIGRLPNGIDLSNSVENEYFCLNLLRAMGLPAANAEMADFGAHRVLVIERFDRLHHKDGRILRLPQEDCCQATSTPPTRKYEKDGGPGAVRLLQLLSGSDTPREDHVAFLKALIAFWLLAATDGHAKNFSVFLSPGGRYRMTPLYDVVSAQPSFESGQIDRNKIKLAMAIGKSRHYRVGDIAPRHFIETAERGGVGSALALQAIGEIAAAARPALEATLAAMPADFPADLADGIARGFNARLAEIDLFLKSSDA